jgi:hypothetical protein
MNSSRLLCCIVCLLAAANATARDAPEDAGPKRLAVLDATSPFRGHVAWKTATILGKDGKPVVLKERARRNVPASKLQPLPIVASHPVPANWAAVEFDASDWPRCDSTIYDPPYVGTSYRTPGSPYEWNVIRLRGAFDVTDPAAVKDLRIDVRYAGGVAVFVNGVEAGRANLPKGALSADTLAEAYPEEAYVGADGFILKRAKKDTPDAERIATRYRSATFAVPADLLRKGLNVLAVAVHRAPVAHAFFSHKEKKRHYKRGVDPWPHCAVFGLALSAAPGSAITPNAERPDGVQVWTAPAGESLVLTDWADSHHQPHLKLTGTQNGVFGGRIVLSSPKTITAPKAVASDLASEDGATIAADAVSVRWCKRASNKTGFMQDWDRWGANRFDLLLDKLPAAVEPMKVRYPRRYRGRRYDPVAMVPLWVAVHVPKDAKPGTYRGTVTVSADGLEPTAVPLTITVAGWTVPDPKAFRTANLIWQSHETTALWYKVPFWSDRHFELMGDGLELTSLAGNKFCHFNLTVRYYHQGNSQSMIRWIRKADGTFDYDFSIFDRYLDLWEERLGKPHLVFLGVFVKGADTMRGKKGKRSQFRDEGTNPVTVSLLDPETGKVTEMEQPLYGTKESVAFWKKPLTMALERLRKRGWYERTAIGAGGDTPPYPQTVWAFHQIWPDCKWMNTAHANPSRFRADPNDPSVFVPVPWREVVWSAGHLWNPDHPRARSERYPTAHLATWQGGVWAFPRVGQGLCNAIHESSPMLLHKYVQMASIQGRCAGIGRVGADFWPLRKGRYGAAVGLSGHTGMHLSVGASLRAYVGPGPDGPVSTEKLEITREGIQLREAVIFLQQARKAGVLGADLREKMDELLLWQARHWIRTKPNDDIHWLAFAGSGCRERDAELYALCAEAAKAVK